MSSAARSSSGVRNLRAMFENNKSDIALDKSPDRGRSPSARMTGVDDGLDKSPALGSRKVTSAFVHVSPVSKPLERTQSSTSASSNQHRMPAPVDSEEEEQSSSLRVLKQTYAKELKLVQAARTNDSNNGDLVKSPLATPTTELTELKLTSENSNESSSMVKNGRKKFDLPEHETETEHTEKPVSAVEDKDAALTSADPKDASLTSTAAKGPNGAGKKDAKSKKPAAKIPAAVAKEPVKREQVPKPKAAPRKSVSSVTSQSTFNAPTQASLTHQQKAASSNEPATSPKTARHVRVPTKPANIPSRLTAPTASSAAKKESASVSNDSAAPKPKTRELSSHLLAPTAASAAKYATEPQVSPKPKPATKGHRQSLAASSAVSKPRIATARQSIDARNAAPAEVEAKSRKVTRPSEGFLERMTRPTTASNSKFHEKNDANTSPRPSQARKSRASSVRTNGSEKKSDATESTPQSATSKVGEDSFHIISAEDTAPEPINESESAAAPESEVKDEPEGKVEVSEEPKTESKSVIEAKVEAAIEEKSGDEIKEKSETEVEDKPDIEIGKTPEIDSEVKVKVEDKPDIEVEKTPEADSEVKVESKEDDKEDAAGIPAETTVTEPDTTSTEESKVVAVPDVVDEPLTLTEEQPTESGLEEDTPEGVLPLTETKNDKPAAMGESKDSAEDVATTTSKADDEETKAADDVDA